MSSSLSRFSGWRSPSLSLGEGLTDSTGARDGARADGVLDRGRRRLFSFSSDSDGSKLKHFGFRSRLTGVTSVGLAGNNLDKARRIAELSWQLDRQRRSEVELVLQYRDAALHNEHSNI